jgi:acylphosphatase
MGDLALSCRISGRVQGVGYRAWTRDTARALGLSGWVRNEPDGSVTALVGGPEDAVRQMVTAMAAGPHGAWVASVSTETAEAPAAAGFAVLRG